jgi:hypothetical protein
MNYLFHKRDIISASTNKFKYVQLDIQTSPRIFCAHMHAYSYARPNELAEKSGLVNLHAEKTGYRYNLRYICLSVFVYILCVRMPEYMCISVFEYACEVCLCVHVCGNICAIFLGLRMRTSLHAFLCGYKSANACTILYVCVCVYIYIYIYCALWGLVFYVRCLCVFVCVHE